MSRGLLTIVIGVALLAVAGTAMGQQWMPGDGHKMHFPQYPNEYGWNVFASYGQELADDWRCSESGPVTDIHFWGSWKGGEAGLVIGFNITIYSDVPASQSGTGYSMPGEVLWGPFYISDFAERHIVPTPEAWEGWYDPFGDPAVWPDHNNFYQYNITDIHTIPGLDEPFEQTAGEIYWLSISADVDSGPGPDPVTWGWKSSYMHFNDDAVVLGDGWEELYEPDLGPAYNMFSIEVDEAGQMIHGMGEFAWDDQWFWYDDEEPGWWNIWFYDHPFSDERWKEIWVSGSVRTQSGVGGMPGDITIAINWSTPAWSNVGNPPGERRRPPMNEDLDPLNPATYLMRQIIYQGPVADVPQGIGELGWNIDEYNPEWVSIDVQGYNFIFDGAISHQCVGTSPQSMDLAFVIHNSLTTTTGACCWPDGTCTMETQSDCESAAINGTYMGDGVFCLGDGDGNSIDDLCELGAPTGACCRPDGSCYVATQTQCVGAGDDYKGDGTACLGDNDGDGVDDVCPPPPGACCLIDGTCIMIVASACLTQGGDYLGDGSVCLGDGDLNGIDDACEGATDLKWFQEPDLSPEGMDVNGTYWDGAPYVLATDFECTSIGPILEVHVFSSWYHDRLPNNNPYDVQFTLSIHTDIPDPDGDGPEYSMPGEILCLYPTFSDFEVRVYADDLVEGWLEPPDNYEPNGDHVCWEYIFHLPGDCIQEGTPDNPIVYWLDVQAFPADDQAFWGWKTAVPPHWNDDAVWAMGIDDASGSLNWMELVSPIGGTGYPYTPGDVNGDGLVDINDVNYLTAFIFTAGPPPVYVVPGSSPPFYAAADCNGDCDPIPNAADLAALIAAVQAMGIPTYCPQYPPGAGGESLDLAFAIYGGDLEPTGACCYQDGSCADGMTAADCASSGGDYGGDGTNCAGTDADQNGVDDFCDDIVTLGACCYGSPAAPSCINTTQTVCEDAGGLAGTFYAGQDCASFTCPITVGACCFEDGSCVDGMTDAACVASGGDYGGDGSACWGVDNDQNGVDDFCDDVVELGACCYGDPLAPTCVNTTQTICAQTFNGTWYVGQDCATFECPILGACCDEALAMCIDNRDEYQCLQYPGYTWYAGEACVDITCPLPVGACCFDDGSCVDGMSEADCVAGGGDYGGDGSACAGSDSDQNGVDDFCDDIVTLGACCYGDPANLSCVNTTQTVCGQTYNGTWHAGEDCATYVCTETNTELKWFQPPDLSPEGMDVNATFNQITPYVLATDFECTSPGAIMDIHIFGSWYHDALPMGDPHAVSFTLSIHADIPDPDGEGPEYSRPGDMICFYPDMTQFDVQIHADGLQEGWLNPPDMYDPDGDEICWEYIFHLDGTCIQEGTPENPIVYWVDIQAFPFEEQALWGWKTAEPPHWNDDAVWAIGTDDPAGQPDWQELYFAGAGYPYMPGDVDGDWDVDPDDVNYLQAWIFGGGPPPPYDVGGFYPAADANGNCMVGELVDLTYLQSWLAGIGPEPEFCPQYPPATGGRSLDLALAIYGEVAADTCAGQMPGDYNNDGAIDTADLTALVQYVAGIGAPAVPAANGDFNGDCRVNQWDITDMQAYLFTGGPGPVDCTCLNPYGPCCIGVVGNANLDPDEKVTIGDISLMIDAKFITGTCVGILECFTEADVNLTGMATPDCDDITIGDISTLIDHLFISGPTVLFLKDCY